MTTFTNITNELVKVQERLSQITVKVQLLPLQIIRGGRQVICHVAEVV